MRVLCPYCRRFLMNADITIGKVEIRCQRCGRDIKVVDNFLIGIDKPKR